MSNDIEKRLKEIESTYFAAVAERGGGIPDGFSLPPELAWLIATVRSLVAERDRAIKRSTEMENQMGRCRGRLFALELDRDAALKSAAAMRRALVGLGPFIAGKLSETQGREDVMRVVNHALMSLDAALASESGKDFVPRVELEKAKEAHKFQLWHATDVLEGQLRNADEDKLAALEDLRERCAKVADEKAAIAAFEHAIAEAIRALPLEVPTLPVFSKKQCQDAADLENSLPPGTSVNATDESLPYPEDLRRRSRRLIEGMKVDLDLDPPTVHMSHDNFKPLIPPGAVLVPREVLAQVREALAVAGEAAACMEPCRHWDGLDTECVPCALEEQAKDLCVAALAALAKLEGK